MAENTDFYSRNELELIFRNAISAENYAKILSLDPPLSCQVEERVITTLFTDLKGFTQLQQTFGMIALARQLILLLEAQQEAISLNNGYLDKFMGDAAMAVFGAPLELSAKEQALAACRTALAIGKKARELDMEVTTGFHTGSAFIGNYVPRNRPNYSPMGSDINFTAKLEQLSRRTGNRPTTSRYTRELLDPEFRTVLVDFVSVRSPDGVLQSEPYYAVVGECATMTKAETALWDRYDSLIQALDSGDSGTALERADELSALHPDDSLFITALARARFAYASSLGCSFSGTKDFFSLGSVLLEACGRLCGTRTIAVLESGIDGLWRFRSELPFTSTSQVFSPDGDALVWLRGLLGAAPLQVKPEGSMGPVNPGSSTTAPAPEPLLLLGFDTVLPIRVKNELAAVLFFDQSKAVDPSTLQLIADSFSGPWTERLSDETRERYQEKIDDATKLEEVNRELEAQSSALTAALREISTLNETLEAKVASAAERLERASSLKRYLPPRVVEDILNGHRDLQPRTERRKITVLFSDVRGFTAATDGLEPEELARLLDAYLSAMSDIAFAAGATIDKFRGDGMMLFFGAPEAVEPREGAIRCLHMAAKMCQEVERLRSAWFDEGYDWDLGVRIGINTGYATVGEFGSPDRMDYTAVGTEVNLAARLEACCETDSIVVSHSTWALVRDSFPCTPLGETNLKGLHKPVRIYQVNWKNHSNS